MIPTTLPIYSWVSPGTPTPLAVPPYLSYILSKCHGRELNPYEQLVAQIAPNYLWLPVTAPWQEIAPSGHKTHRELCRMRETFLGLRNLGVRLSLAFQSGLFSAALSTYSHFPSLPNLISNTDFSFFVFYGFPIFSNPSVNRSTRSPKFFLNVLDRRGRL